jgi:chemotaxis signal transduction protein
MIKNKNLKEVISLLENSKNDDLIDLEHGLLNIKLNNLIYDIPLKNVLALLRVKDIRVHAFPSSNPDLRGLIMYDGKWLPLLHRKWCGQGVCKKKLCQHIVLVKNEYESFGIMVQGIVNISTVEHDNLLDLNTFHERGLFHVK